MTISVFSRYADNTVIPIADRNNVSRPTIIITPPTQPLTYNIAVHVWSDGDQIDYLSFSAYGDETQWWRIANVNPEILFWDSVPAGTQIRVPNA
jgi:hypothetical protein